MAQKGETKEKQIKAQRPKQQTKSGGNTNQTTRFIMRERKTTCPSLNERGDTRRTKPSPSLR